MIVRLGQRAPRYDGTITLDEGLALAVERKIELRGEDDYFFPPHGGKPPSDEAVKKATDRYCKR